MKRQFPIILAVVALAAGATQAMAQTAITLGTAASFAVLAGTSVTSVGSTIVNGDLGVSPGATVNETPAIVVNGTRHLNDAFAGNAQLALTAAYDEAAGRTPTVFLGAAYDLGGDTLTAGVYNGTSSLAITGTLTLDAQGNSNAVWIFQAGSTLTGAAGSQILFINGGSANNVFWQVGSSATFLASSLIVGSVLANTDITLGLGAMVDGRLLAQSAGAVSLNGNTITVPTAIPEPAATTLLVAGGLSLLIGLRRYRRRESKSLPAG